MQFWSNLLVVVQVLSAVTMIALVLIQHGKGADMGASFGSGASGSLFGATGSANFLSRSTAVCATIFFACTLGLSAIAGGRGLVQAGPTNRLDRAFGSPPAASAPATGVAPTVAAPVASAAASSRGPAIPTR